MGGGRWFGGLVGLLVAKRLDHCRGGTLVRLKGRSPVWRRVHDQRVVLCGPELGSNGLWEVVQGRLNSVVVTTHRGPVNIL